MHILSLNIGSSTFKASVFDLETLKELQTWKCDNASYEYLAQILENYDDRAKISVVVHRIVHGGSFFDRAVIIDSSVKEKIEQLSDLAPLHNPVNLKGVLEAERLLPEAKQIGVFDTAFHQTIPSKAYLYALPFEFYEEYQVRRYGFHGISHKYVSIEAAKELKSQSLPNKRIITCHLGNGCSMTAVLDGKSMDTSMGFTPLEGLVMGTRSGDLDPALPFYLQKKLAVSATDMEELLWHKSGLLGLSNTSSDMRDIWADYQRGEEGAVRALEVFTYRIQKYIASYIGVLGGIDALVFTGGIGEKADYIRDMSTRALEHIDELSKKIMVIPTDEQLQMAREAQELNSTQYQHGRLFDQ